MTDLDSRERVCQFVDAFYARMLRDPVLAPIFVDIADIQLEVHLPHIKNYWCKLLLGETDYRRHTMNIHRALNQKRPLTGADFEQWISVFERTLLEERYSGLQADKARRVANTIAANMKSALVSDSG